MKVPSFEGMEFIKGLPLVLTPSGNTILVLDVWATYAAACVESAPFLSAVQARFPAPVVVVGVTVETVPAARPYVEDMGSSMDYRVAVDPEGARLTAIIGTPLTFQLPRTFVFDRAFRLAWSGSPLDPGLQEAIESAGGIPMSPAVPEPRSVRSGTATTRTHERSKSGSTFDRMFDTLERGLGKITGDDGEDAERRRRTREEQRRAGAARQDEGVQLGRATVAGGYGVVPAHRPPLLEGWLYKKSRGVAAAWNRRYWRQSGAYIYYFWSEEDTQPRNRFSLLRVREVSKRYHSSFGPCIGVSLPERLYLLSPERNCAIPELRQWYEGFCNWEKWLEAHPNDDVPESPEITFVAKRTIVDSVTDKVKAVVGDSSESDSDAEGARSRRPTRGNSFTRRGTSATSNAEPERPPKRSPNSSPRGTLSKSTGSLRTSEPEALPPPKKTSPKPSPSSSPRQSPLPSAVVVPTPSPARDPPPKLKAIPVQRESPKPTAIPSASPRESPKPAPAPETKRVYVDDPPAEQPVAKKPQARVDTRAAEKEAEQRTVEVRMMRGQELDLSMMGLPRLDPAWLMGMRAVRFIDLSFNTFSVWPEEALAPHADLLQVLVMAGCQLPVIPPSVGKFTALRELTLNGNAFGAVPREIAACVRLEKLDLSNNRITALPESIGWLNKLEELFVMGNPLGRLPDSIGNLRKLQVLDASACRLNAIPDEMVYLTQLMDLNLMQNNLIRLPARMGWWLRLVSLNVSGNQLKDVPLSAGLCEGLNEPTLGLNIVGNPIQDADMVAQHRIGADRLFNYLERRMMMQDFNQRAVMTGYPSAWPYVPMESVPGALGIQQQRSGTVRQASPRHQRSLDSLSAQHASVPAPSAGVGQTSKLDKVRTAVEIIITRDLMPVIAVARGDLLSTKAEPAKVAQHGKIIAAMRPHGAALVALCELKFKVPQPVMNPSDDRLKQLRLSLLFHLKELECTLEGTQAALPRAEAARMADIAKLVRSLKEAST